MLGREEDLSGQQRQASLKSRIKSTDQISGSGLKPMAGYGWCIWIKTTWVFVLSIE